MKSWIGVDLDGTLAHYEGYGDGKTIGKPIDRMLLRVKGWLNEGKRVKIFTARVGTPQARPDAEKMIKEWCLKHIGQELEVPCVKDYGMYELWDDRAIRVEKNTGKILC